MTREEFESILEEAFLEGYNNAYEEIEEILDEDYIDIEDDYEVYDENLTDYQKYDIRREYEKYKKAHPDLTKKELSSVLRRATAFCAKRTNEKMADKADDYIHSRQVDEDDLKFLNDFKKGKLRAAERMKNAHDRYYEKENRNHWLNKLKKETLYDE